MKHMEYKTFIADRAGGMSTKFTDFTPESK